MSDFKKPVEKIVRDSEYIQSLVNVNLKKDLNENDKIPMVTVLDFKTMKGKQK